MTKRFLEFQSNLQRATDLVGLGQSIGAVTYGRVDATDLYRAALINAVAALDTYVHAIVQDRAIDIIMGRTLTVHSGMRFGLTPSAVAEMLHETTVARRELLAMKYVAERISLETYQRPDDIAAALAAVGISRIWSLAFPDANAAKTALGLVVSRRNVIAHQCDLNPLHPGTVIPLADSDAKGAIGTIDRTAQAIDSQL